MSTKHKSDCNMAFGHKDKSCPRCQELLNGSAPRAGWQKSYYNSREYQLRVGEGPHYEAFKKELKAHDCKKHGCGPVCVAFDW